MEILKAYGPSIVGLLPFLWGFLFYTPVNSNPWFYILLAFLIIPMLLQLCKTSFPYIQSWYLFLLVGCAGLMLLLNGINDPNPPQTHIVTVLGYKRTKLVGTISVNSWRKGCETEILRIPRSILKSLVKEMPDQWTSNRQMLKVSTKPGRFGIEWIVSVELVPSTSQ